MIPLVLVIIGTAVALGISALPPEAFGTSDCDDPRCYALLRTSRTSPIDGLQFKLDAPSIFIDRNPDVCENFATSAGWMIARRQPHQNADEWLESGVTNGFIKGVGCNSKLSAYYGFNNVFSNSRAVYQEFIIPTGRVDPGNEVSVILQRSDVNREQLWVYVTTPHYSIPAPDAQLSFLGPNNLYYADFGIEGTVSAVDEYSSIPMSKFTDMKILQDILWIIPPTSATVDTPNTGEGYMGQKCRNNSFAAGTITSLDCGVPTGRNSPPNTLDKKTIRIHTNAPVTIGLDGKDFDKDYLIFKLTGLPENGAIIPSDLGERIPNTDGDSASLKYKPSSNPPKSDIIKYSVTDARQGHTREGQISIIGQTSPFPIPDKVDDFAHTLDGTTIRFTWSHPDDDGGSEITHYVMQTSRDGENWRTHRLLSETKTSLIYERNEGFDAFFRIFAHNKNGASPSSNIVHVHIIDTTPPTIQIRKPDDGITIKVPEIKISGVIFDLQSDVEDTMIRIDGVTSRDPIEIEELSGSFIVFESKLLRLESGKRTITVSASNVDGHIGSSSIDITVDVRSPNTLDLFFDDFEDDMSSWILTEEDNTFWEIRNLPISPVPNSLPGNKVAGADNCDNICTMTMIDRVDLTQMEDPKLSFYRYVGEGADISKNEGIIAYISTDDGNTWNILERFTADPPAADDGRWHLEEYDLSRYSSSTEFKVRFEGISSSTREDVELDNVSIFDASIDTFPPVIALAGDNPQIIEAGNGYSELGAATDDGSAVVINSTGFADQVGSYMIFYDSTDEAGNKAVQRIRIVNVVDTIPPLITAPSDIITEATAPLTAVELGNATVTDADPNPAVSNDSPGVFPVGSTTVIWTATDSSDNVSKDTQTVTIQDTTRPVFTDLPSSFSHSAGSPSGGIVTFDPPTATDTADANVTVTSSHKSGDSFSIGDTVVTFTATDDSGNTVSHDITITVEYNPLTISTIPDIRMPHTETRTIPVTSADPDGNPISFSLYDAPGFATIQGIQDGQGVITLGPAESDIGTHAITVNVTAGPKSNSTSFAVQVFRPDTTPPAVTAPPDITREATAPLTPVSLGEPTVYDDVDPNPTISNDAPDAFPVDTTLVIWTATDSSNNTSTDTQTIIIQDTTKPVFTSLPSIKTKYIADSSKGTVLVYDTTPAAIDIADPDVTITSSHRSGDLLSPGTHTLEFTATDDSGNVVSSIFTTTVLHRPVDLSTIPDVDMTHTETRTIPVRAADSADYPISLTLQGSPVFATINSDGYGIGTITLDPAESDVGTHTITVLAHANYNLTTTTFDVLVRNVDTTPPAVLITGENPIHHEVYADYEDPGAICDDDVDPDTPAEIDASLVDVLLPGAYNVTYTCTDSSDNTSKNTRFVNVVDTTKPIIALKGEADITHYVGVPYEDAGAWCKDNFDRTRHIEADDSLDVDRPGVQTLRYNCEDFFGNVALEKTRTVTILVDNISPVITAPQDITAEATAPLTIIPLGRAVATDNVDPNPTISNDAPDGFTVGTTTVTWIATDFFNNTGTDFQTVTILDTTAPVIRIIGDTPIHHEVYADYEDPGVVCDDDVSLDTPAEIDASLVDVLLPGAYDVTYTCTDSSGNTSTKSRTVNVEDTTSPFITLKGETDITHYVGVPYEDAGAWCKDNFDRTRHIEADNALNVNILGEQELLYNCQDFFGNDALTITRTITITADTKPPVITAPDDVTKEATAPLTPVSIGTAFATDNTDPNPTISNDAPDLFSLGDTTVIWTATDRDNNTSTDTQTITILDTTPPALSGLPSSSEHEAESAEGIRITFDMPTASDLVDGDITVMPPHRSDILFPVGITTVTFTATDNSGNTVTHSIVITVNPPPKFETITDDFTDLSEWSLVLSDANSARGGTPVSNYTITIDEDFGVPAPSVKIAGGGYNTLATISKTFDLDDLGDDDLFLGVDIWIENGVEQTDFTTAFGTPLLLVGIENADGESLLSTSSIKTAYQWSYHEFDIGGILEGTPSITVLLSLWDWTEADFKEKMHIDNVYLGTESRFGIVRYDPIPDDAPQESGLLADKPEILMAGDESISHEVHTTYEDPGAVCDDGTGRAWPADASELDTDVIGTYHVEYSCAGADSISRTVNIVDTTDPSISFKGRPIVEHPHGTAYQDAGATCSDNYDSDRRVDTADVIDTSEPGPQTLRYTCTDSSDNMAKDKNRIVLVLEPGEEPLIVAPPVDPPQTTTAPTIQDEPEQKTPQAAAPPVAVPSPEPSDDAPQNSTLLAPADIVSEATGPLTVIPLGEATTPTLDLNITHNAPDAFPLGDTIIIWTATESDNSTHTANQTVTIQDTTPPAFSGLPQSSTHTAESADGATVTFETPTALDLVDLDVSVSISHDSGSLFSVGNTTVIFTASDDSENVATHSMAITVESEPSLQADDPKQESEPVPEETSEPVQEPKPVQMPEEPQVEPESEPDQ